MSCDAYLPLAMDEQGSEGRDERRENNSAYEEFYGVASILFQSDARSWLRPRPFGTLRHSVLGRLCKHTDAAVLATVRFDDSVNERRKEVIVPDLGMECWKKTLWMAFHIPIRVCLEAVVRNNEDRFLQNQP